jgi:putative restriction endonuclease
MATATEWLTRFGNLKVDRARGNPAPHKPLLLLAVLDLAESGELSPGTLPLSPELAFRFTTYWGIVAARRTQAPDIRLPFHHLKGDKVWVPLDESGNPSPDRKLTRFVALSQDLIECLNDPVFRRQARQLLISNYFLPPERLALYELVGLPAPDNEGNASDVAASTRTEALERGRDVRFRLRVVAAYSYACALTGHRLTTVRSGSIVDAAHIHQFADSRNNDPRNGIALCKNAHWLFDQGLWTVSDAYRVIIAVGKFTESNPDGKRLAEYHNNPLRLPADQKLWPSHVHLAWHRKHKFQGV